MKQANKSPLDILSIHSIKEGVVIHVENKLTGTSAYVAYPGATEEDVHSGVLFKSGVWSANFTADDLGLQLALTVLKVYKDLVGKVNRGKLNGDGEDKLRLRPRS